MSSTFCDYRIVSRDIIIGNSSAEF